MRVGLVLGAGGVVGASWLIGALEALESETGWRAADAERIVGTSAGSVIGAITAAGIDPAYMSAYVTGGSLEAFAEAEHRAERVAERAAGGGRGAARAAGGGRAGRSGRGRGALRPGRCCGRPAMRPPLCSPVGFRAGSSRRSRSGASCAPS